MYKHSVILVYDVFGLVRLRPV